MTPKTEDERRVMVLYLTEEVVLDRVLFNLRHMPQFVVRAKSVNVPDDVRIVGVSHDWSRRAFGFLLRHDSFSVVPDGEMPPVLDAVTEWEAVNTDLLRGVPDVVVVS